MPDQLNSMLDLSARLGPIFLFVFYVAIVLWTWKDARRRINDPILVASSVAISMLPIVGVLVYMLLRPPEYLADVRERELEIRAMEHSLGQNERCPQCSSHIEADYLACPVCTAALRRPCSDCKRPLDPRWAMCPYCTAKVPGARQPESPRSGYRQQQQPARTAKSEPKRSSTPPPPPQPKAKPETTDKPKPDLPRIADTIDTEPFGAAKRDRITGAPQRSELTQPFVLPGTDNRPKS
jgi:hypothetical protein